MKAKRKVFLLLFLILLVPVWAVAEGIKWQGYKEGMAKGKTEKKRIFVNFHADW